MIKELAIAIVVYVLQVMNNVSLYPQVLSIDLDDSECEWEEIDDTVASAVVETVAEESMMYVLDEMKMKMMSMFVSVIQLVASILA